MRAVLPPAWPLRAPCDLECGSCLSAIATVRRDEHSIEPLLRRPHLPMAHVVGPVGLDVRACATLPDGRAAPRADHAPPAVRMDCIVSDRLRALLELRTPDQRSPEWLEMRKNYITGSSMDTVLGTNPYETAEKLLLQKAGMPNDFTGNEATAYGTRHEPDAVRAYEAKTGHTVVDLGLVPHPDIPFVAYSPDGIVMRKGLPPLLLEIKCPIRRAIRGVVPAYYANQVQAGLDVFGLDEADFVEYRPAAPGRAMVLSIVRVRRCVDWRATSLPVLQAFWDGVLEWRARGWETHPAADAYVAAAAAPAAKEDDDLLCGTGASACSVRDDE